MATIVDDDCRDDGRPDDTRIERDSSGQLAVASTDYENVGAVRYVDSYRNDEVASLPKIASWTTLDVHYAHFVDLFGTEATFYVGARNLTDRDPPPLPSGRDGVLRHNLRPGFDGFVHVSRDVRFTCASGSAHRADESSEPVGRACPVPDAYRRAESFCIGEMVDRHRGMSPRAPTQPR